MTTIAVWFLLASGNYGYSAQLGPFATKQDCTNTRVIAEEVMRGTWACVAATILVKEK